MNHHNLTRREAVGNWTLVVCRSWTPESYAGPVAESPTDRTKVQLWPRRAMVKLINDKSGAWLVAGLHLVRRRNGTRTTEGGRCKQFT